MVSPNEIGNKRVLSDRVIASVLLITMSIQYIPIDGWETSYFKTIISILSFYFLISRSRYVSKAVMLTFVYGVVLCTIYFLQFSGGGLSIIHTLLYWISFCLFYNLVYHNNVYTYDSFINLIKAIIYLYTITIIIQQVLFLAGIYDFPLANMHGQTYISFMRLPSLAIEPSHAGRVLTVCIYAILKVSEYQNGKSLSLRELFSLYKRPLLSAFYSVLCIGSGTAVVGMAIVALYFIKRQYAIVVVFILALFFFVAPYVDYEPVTRAINTLNAMLTNDFNEVKAVDNSASVRVSFIFGLRDNFDLYSSKVWWGYGSPVYRTITTIDIYGFLVYLFLLLLVGVCCISDMQGLLFFVVLLGMDVRNFAYTFAILMVLSAVKYFKHTLMRL